MSDMFERTISFTDLDLSGLAHAREKFREALMSIGIDRQSTCVVVEGVFEIVTNAIKHGKDKDIVIGINDRVEEIEIGIYARSHEENQGPLSDSLARACFNLELYLEAEGKMGLYTFVSLCHEPAVTDGWIHGRFPNPMAYTCG